MYDRSSHTRNIKGSWWVSDESSRYGKKHDGTARYSGNKLSAAFPEFEEVKDRLIYGEVRHQGGLTIRQRMLTVITVLATVEGDDLEEQLYAALRQGVTPEELQEVFHQAAPYIGIAKAEKGLAVLKRVFEAKGIALPLKKQGTVTEENRLEQGIHAQKALFGPMIDRMRASAPADQKPVQDYLSAYCFGDTYTRSALDLATREMLTFISALFPWADATARQRPTWAAIWPSATARPCWYPPWRNACRTSAFRGR
jgi:alkylhydroperoxidase/carboxymuconolactone decarboxylase family protein YurZ